MFGFKKPAPTITDRKFTAEAIMPDAILPYPPVIVRQENLSAIKTLLADLSEQNIAAFIKTQETFSYRPVTQNYPFGTNREPPVFAQMWEYPNMKPCCKVLCLLGQSGSFTLVTKSELRLLTLFPGDQNKKLAPAALLSVPTGSGVNISVTGDSNVFKGVIYLEEADATRLMTERYEEAIKAAAHFKTHGASCPSCPTGNSAKALAATYG